MVDHTRLLATCALGAAIATAAAPAVVALTGPRPVRSAAETRLTIVVEEPSGLRETRLKLGQICPVPQAQGDAAAPVSLPSPMAPRLVAQR
jgi:hypothetical protein